MKTVAALLSLLLLAASAFSANNTIVAAADPWPPFIDPANPTGGLSLEIVRAAFKTQGYEVTMHYVPWARAETGVKAGTYDILPNVWYTEARAKELLFGASFATNVIKFIKLKGDPFVFKGLESLKGKRVGTVRGYGYGDAFNTSPLFVREDVADVVTNVKKLLRKRIDLTLEDEIVARSFINKEDSRILNEIAFTNESLSSNTLHVAAGLKNPRSREFIDAFNRGVATIKSDGTLKTILMKYGMGK